MMLSKPTKSLHMVLFLLALVTLTPSNAATTATKALLRGETTSSTRALNESRRGKPKKKGGAPPPSLEEGGRCQEWLVCLPTDGPLPASILLDPTLQCDSPSDCGMEEDSCKIKLFHIHGYDGDESISNNACVTAMPCFCFDATFFSDEEDPVRDDEDADPEVPVVDPPTDTPVTDPPTTAPVECLVYEDLPLEIRTRDISICASHADCAWFAPGRPASCRVFLPSGSTDFNDGFLNCDVGNNYPHFTPVC